jgi:hypothetical protein
VPLGGPVCRPLSGRVECGWWRPVFRPFSGRIGLVGRARVSLCPPRVAATCRWVRVAAVTSLPGSPCAWLPSPRMALPGSLVVEGVGAQSRWSARAVLVSWPLAGRLVEAVGSAVRRAGVSAVERPSRVWLVAACVLAVQWPNRACRPRSRVAVPAACRWVRVATVTPSAGIAALVSRPFGGERGRWLGRLLAGAVGGWRSVGVGP